MKKTNYLLLGMCFLLSFSACSNNETSNSTSSVNEIVTGVEIVGPDSVLVGKTINLTVDVIGTTNDDVSWTSSDNNIATVSSEGVVTGVNEGIVDITATSIKDSTKFKTFTSYPFDLK